MHINNKFISMLKRCHLKQSHTHIQNNTGRYEKKKGREKEDSCLKSSFIMRSMESNSERPLTLPGRDPGCQGRGGSVKAHFL